jgi:hypothetical protein
MLRVLRQDSEVIPLKREILTYKDSQADCEAQSKSLIVTVAQTHGKPAALKARG